ncbi:hypothetical protein MKX08_000901 [Trichoderma sp. CBMAI-0020]|nr:hypothetical protein MKX08_000901 [Trichoderma sp. CBMAI-0020]
MARYYQDTLFTLATELKSECDDETLSIPRPFDRLARLPYQIIGKQKGYFYIFKQKKRAKTQYLDKVDQSELLSRVWVFQEWFLSAKIIHLTLSNTYLESRTQAPRTIGYQDVEAPDMGLWYELAQSYSRLSLTNTGDHLNAIAGMATEFSKAMSSSFSGSAVALLESTWHESYALGLWLSDIDHGLLWRGTSECSKYAIAVRRRGCGWHLMILVNHFEIISIIRDMEQNSALYLITMADMLHVKGKIQPIVACGRLTAALDKDLVILTGDRLYARQVGNRTREISTDGATAAPRSQRYQVQQPICPITAPTAAAGWGTFERLDLPRPRVDGENYLVNALQISR